MWAPFLVLVRINLANLMGFQMLGNQPLRVSVREFLDHVSCNGRSHPYCGQHRSVGWGCWTE